MKIGWKPLGFVLAVLMVPSSLWAADEKDETANQTHSFTGKWTNKKFGTSGPLKCTMTETEPGKWKADFTGTFQNDPFQYQADFQSKKVRKTLNIGGNAKVRGHDYQWTGTIKNGVLNARYKSSVGYYGEFVMKIDDKK